MVSVKSVNMSIKPTPDPVQLLQPVILAGGSGTRLWPLSRASYPKQFQVLGHPEYSLLQQAYMRLEALASSRPISIFANSEHRFIIAEQVRQLQSEASAQIILEPCGRNTAAPVLLAALAALEQEPEAILLLCAADHHLPDTVAFQEAARHAARVAAQHPRALLALGIQPTGASSDYGYIKLGERLADATHRIERFTEKPDAETAAQFVATGEYLWNAGIFVGKAQAFLEQAAEHCPQLLAGCKRCWQELQRDYDFLRLPGPSFSGLESVAVDYALMEPSRDAIVVKLDCEWSDLGSWNSIWSSSALDAQGNAVIGDVVSHDCDNSYLRSDSRLLAVLGVDDLIVVETRDAVLVGARDKLDAMRALVDKLKLSGREEVEGSTLVYRPWGSYESLAHEGRYQVKRIVVSPGQKLSVQMHHHRAEYWVVVSGIARVYLDGEDSLVNEGNSVYIPLGSVHALENPGKLDLVLIEVQSGGYLGEDDIVRFEDRYGRV